MSAHLSRLRRVEERLRRRRAVQSGIPTRTDDEIITAALDVAPEIEARLARRDALTSDEETLLAAAREYRERLKIAGAAGHAPTMPGEPR